MKRFLSSRRTLNFGLLQNQTSYSRYYVTGRHIDTSFSPFSPWAGQFRGSEQQNLSATQTKLVHKLILKTLQYLRDPSKSTQSITVIEDSLSKTIDSIGPSKFMKAKKTANISLSKLQRAYALTCIAYGNYVQAEDALCEADAFQKGYIYGDDQYVERTSLLCDWAACSAYLGDFDTADRHLKRGLYMGQRAYKRSDGVVTSVLLNLAELQLLKGDIESSLSYLKECSTIIVSSKHRTVSGNGSKAIDFVNLKDIFGQELSFLLYCSLTKSYLLKNSLEEAELYLDIIKKRYLTKNTNSDITNILNLNYSTLVAIKCLKQYQQSLDKQYFQQYQYQLVNALSSAKATKERNLSTVYKSALLNHSEQQEEILGLCQESIVIENKEYKVHYPSGFFVGGFLDILTLRELEVEEEPVFTLDDLF